MLGFFLALLFGIASGLIPGLHINSASMLMNYLSLNDLIPLSIGIAIPLGILPLLYISASDSENVASMAVLKKLKEQSNLSLVPLAVSISCIFGAIFAFAFYLLFPEALLFYFSGMKGFLFYIVLFASIFLVIKSSKPLHFLVFFLASGLIGFLSFDLLSVEKFFPMFSGFFALPALLTSGVFSKSFDIKMPKISGLVIPCLAGSLLGFFSAIIPAANSPSLIASIVVLESINPIVFLSIVYSFLSSQSLYNFIAFEDLGKARTGAVLYANGSDYTLFFFGIVLGSILVPLLFRLGFLSLKINTKLIALFLFAIAFWLEGVLGIFIMALAFFLSMLRNSQNVSALSHLGSIILGYLVFNL